MANWTTIKEAIASVIKTNGNQEITGAILQNTLNSIINSIGENATFAGVAIPTTNPGTPDGPTFYIATTAGSYSNFGSIKVLKGESAILRWNNGVWAKSTFKPMTDFNSVFNADGKSLTEFESGIIYDVSAHNDGAVFESLSALLGSSNLSTLIPTSVRHGGMSIRFIQGSEQSSDNKYIQYRYMSSDAATDATFTNLSNWQGVDDEPVAESKNLVTSGGAYNSIYSKTGNTTTLQLTWTTEKRIFLQEVTNPAKIANATNEYAISNYIDITNLANAVYEFGGLHGLTNIESPSINFYDENKNHIGYLYEDGDYSLEKSNIPSGAKYILICQCTVSEYPTSSVSVKEVIPSTIILQTEQIVEGNKTQKEINDRVNANIDEIKNKIDSFEGKIVEPKLSWINSNRVDITNSSTSKIIAAGSDFSVSDYIEIPNNFDIARVEGVQAYKNINSYPINFYDADKAWIDCSGDVKGAYDFTEIIPANAKYIVLCQYSTAEYPIANVSIAFETNATLATIDKVEDIVSEHLKPLEAGLSESSIKVTITQDDIDSTVSNPNFVVENGTIKSNSTIFVNGSNFMLFKPEITAVEFTIGDLWDNNRFELCLGCGYYNEARVNAGAVLVAPNDYFIIDSVGTNNADPGTILAQDARENPIPIVSVGDRCMVEIVLDKYILGWVWNNTQNRWDYWFMLNPTDPWSLCNPVHTRVRYGWNQRIGIGLSVVYASASAGLEMMKDVKILSRKGTNLEIYHNKVRMGRTFFNKKWLAIGDSITAYDGLNGWGYVGYTSRRNMLDTINCGNSGWTICDIWQKHASFAPYEEINVDWQDAVAELGVNDVVTIFAGTNDFHSVGRTDIGTVEPYRYPTTLGKTDPTDANAKNPRTTLGALRLLIEKLQDTNPSVKIIVFAPFLMTDSDYPVNTEGMTMREFSDAICDVAKEYGLEHYNMCDYAGINTINIESLTNDRLHPNQKGGERLGEIMARWIN